VIAEKPRAPDSNKGKFGHVLVIGGSYGKAGAPAMASLAALRMGAGLVTAAVPLSCVNTVARITPEFDDGAVDGGRRGAVSFKNLDAARLEALLKKMTVLAIGPGLSTEGDASEFARQMVEKTTLPVVIDADALNAFDKRETMLDGRARTMVLTPHPGEMARLVGMTVKQVEADRVALARRFAVDHKLTAGVEGVADAGGASGRDCWSQHDGESGDGEGRKWRYFDGDCGGDAGPVSGRCRASGRGGGLSAWAGRRLCGQSDGPAYCSCYRYGHTSVGCVSVPGEGRGWVDLDMRFALRAK